MTDYSKLIARVRSPFALTERDAQEIADALEAQARRIAGYQKDADDYLIRLDELNALRARIAELEAALTDCADALEAWVDDLYARGSVSAGYGEKYEIDVAVVNAARAALSGEK
jgi:uncharacterized membrane protein YccC